MAEPASSAAPARRDRSAAFPSRARRPARRHPRQRSSRCRRRPASSPTSSSPSRTGPAEFRAFFAYHDALLLRESGLSKGDKEMIIVATSGINRCLYCVVAHGALLRIYEKNPLVADQVAVNHRKADITPRQRAMLDFAVKVTHESHLVGDADFAALREHGFSRRRRLGHRRHRRAVRPLEPDRQRQLDAAERRVLPDGPRAARQGLRPPRADALRRRHPRPQRAALHDAVHREPARARHAGRRDPGHRQRQQRRHARLAGGASRDPLGAQRRQPRLRRRLDAGRAARRRDWVVLLNNDVLVSERAMDAHARRRRQARPRRRQPGARRGRRSTTTSRRTPPRSSRRWPERCGAAGSTASASRCAGRCSSRSASSTPTAASAAARTSSTCPLPAQRRPGRHRRRRAAASLRLDHAEGDQARDRPEGPRRPRLLLRQARHGLAGAQALQGRARKRSRAIVARERARRPRATRCTCCAAADAGCRPTTFEPRRFAELPGTCVSGDAAGKPRGRS